MQDRIPALDGLRTFAVLLVFMRHVVHLFSRMDGTPYAENGLFNFFYNGWIGVDLFFVLSGYLITRSLLSTDKHAWKIYAQKRFLRIFPAYAAILALCILGFFPYYKLPQDGLGFSILYHLLFLQDYLPANINVVFWSLGVEEKFYILAPFLVFFLHRCAQAGASWRFAAAIGAVFLTGYILRIHCYFRADMPGAYADFFFNVRAPFHANLEPLLLGVLIAFCKVSRNEILAKKPWICFWVSSAGLFAFAGAMNMMRHINFFDVLLQPLVISFLMAGLVFAVVSGYRNGLLENRFTAYMSRVSYSFYLVHFPLAPASYYLLQAAGGGGVAFFAVIYFIVSLAGASLSYALFERPFLKIKDQISSSARAARAAAPAS